MVTLLISGNILDVLQGDIDPSKMHTIDPHRYGFALGAGSFSNERGIGETIIIDSEVHVSWVQKKALKTDSKTSFQSPFLMGISPQKMERISHIKPSTPITFQAFYEKLLGENPKGFAICGQALMEKLHTTYVKTPPIYHENINEHRDKYWAEMEVLPKTKIFYFGVVLPLDIHKNLTKSPLGRGFYKNPHDTPSTLIMSHTHAAILNDTHKIPDNLPDFKRSLQHLAPTGIRHLLTSGLIQENCYTIFQIKTVRIS